MPELCFHIQAFGGLKVEVNFGHCMFFKWCMCVLVLLYFINNNNNNNNKYNNNINNNLRSSTLMMGLWVAQKRMLSMILS